MEDVAVSAYEGATAAPAFEEMDDEQRQSLGPKRASAALFAARRGQDRSLFTMRLNRSSLEAGEDINVVVRIPNFADRAVIKDLPKDIQKKVADLMFSNAAGTPNRFDSLANMDRTTKRGKEVANLYTVVGWVEPRAYFTQEEADRNGGVFVEDIPYEDRWDLVRIVDGNDDLASRRITPFLRG